MTTSFRNVSALVAAALVMAATPVLVWGQGNLSPVQDAAARNVEVTKLVAVLQSDAAPFDKAKACQRLALIGTQEAVPALAALLADERLGNYARFGLERIPDPSVDDALREALGKLQGQLLVGVINSVGVCRDANAVGALTRLIGDSNLEIAPQALAALGQIATPEAVEALHQSLASDSAAVRAASADACLVGAERLAAQGQREEAVGLYEAVRRADVPRPVRAAATRGAILTRQSAGVPLLLEQLKADDDMFGIALRASRELPGSDVTQSLVVELDHLSPARQVLLIRAIGDRQDAAASPALCKLARTLPSDKLRVRTLRGYIRVAKQMGLPPEQQLEMCEEALRAAQRDEERRLVLDVLGGIPTTKAMSIVVPHLAQPALAEKATAAALRIGEGIVQSEPGLVADAMRQVLKSSVSGEQAAHAEKLLQLAGSLTNASPLKKP